MKFLFVGMMSTPQPNMGPKEVKVKNLAMVTYKWLVKPLIFIRLFDKPI